MYPWKAPHISEHCPPIEPLASDDIDTQLVRPGTTSCLLGDTVLDHARYGVTANREDTGLHSESYGIAGIGLVDLGKEQYLAAQD